MTDKQIIDGVKTTRKDFVDNFAIELTNRNIKEREQIGNKYFDIIQAKEQECEKLKKWLPIVARLEEQFKSHEKAKGIDYKTYAEQVFTELDQLKAENEELKNFHINLVGVKECEIKELVKLKQTLTEIKEIAEKQYHTKLVDKDCINCDESFAQILQKCEVLDE